MRSPSLAVAATTVLGLFSSSALAYYGNTTTVALTTTEFVTTCPYPTTFTVSTCTNDVCQPTVVTVTEETTITIPGTVVCPVVSTPSGSASASASASASSEEGSVVTTQVTVTDFTTYCPYPTTLTITKCENNKCHPTTIPVETATTVTVTGEVICPTTTSTSPKESSSEAASSEVITTQVTVTDYTTYCPLPTTIVVSTCNEDKCHPTTIEVTTPSTVVVPGTVVCPTTSVATPSQSEATSQPTTISSVVTTGVTTTDYTTYCPSPTTIVVSTCNEEKCHPTTIEVSTPTTVVVPGTVVHPSTSATIVTTTAEQPPASPEVSTIESVVTTPATLTGYTTYCPEPTTIVLTTCSDDQCKPHTVSATGGETVSIPATIVVPSSHTTQVEITVSSASVPASEKPTTPVTVAAVSSFPAVSTETPSLVTPAISIAGAAAVNVVPTTAFGLFAIILALIF
ncbi:conserved hypothetical protein [Candida albicans WO-1]|uniref:Uncharacterized protein n=1 Tax=Candida albicans (strain WO-1) TaxID=294748 RepID=C4YMQ4_CANAW|nr:conserved hypothetical protein [Candida albicans WO-1]